MKIYTIDKKKVLDNKLSISTPTLLFSDSVQVQAVHEVSADETGRIDLVSLSEYGTHDYTDIILKFNGISNPFSLLFSGLILSVEIQ